MQPNYNRKSIFGFQSLILFLNESYEKVKLAETKNTKIKTQRALSINKLEFLEILDDIF